MLAQISKSPRIKVGVASADEAQQAIAAGADALGLIPTDESRDGSAAHVNEQTIAAICRAVPERIGTFLITGRQRAADIIALQRRCGTNTIQLCEPLRDGSHADLRGALPGVALVQVIPVQGTSSIADAVGAAAHVDALLLTPPRGAVDGEACGYPDSGNSHWGVAAEIRRAVNVPVFLAGGLRAQNVRAAIALVGPWGVDVCRGVTRQAGLSADQLRIFVQAVRAPLFLEVGESQFGAVARSSGRQASAVD